MATNDNEKPDELFAFTSSIADDVGHHSRTDKAYEWWYFDAISDDGSEAVVINFLDDFREQRRGIIPFAARTNGSNAGAKQPAVNFTYLRDGKVLYKSAINLPIGSYEASEIEPFVKIGNSSVVYRSAVYGPGYDIQIDVPLSDGRRLRASFEWLVIEYDVAAKSVSIETQPHYWNMAAPRCDVTGKAEVTSEKGGNREVFQFRGTGYHDHRLGSVPVTKNSHDWQWGRAHFAQATVVYCRHCCTGDGETPGTLILIQSGGLVQSNARFAEDAYRRNRFGKKYPTLLRVISVDNVSLTVKPFEVIEANSFGMRFLSDMSLELGDGLVHETTGISEFVVPDLTRSRWLGWLTGRKSRK